MDRKCEVWSVGSSDREAENSFHGHLADSARDNDLEESVRKERRLLLLIAKLH